MRTFFTILYLIILVAFFVVLLRSALTRKMRSKIRTVKPVAGPGLPSNIETISPVSGSAEPSNIKSDEHVVFFNTAARTSSDGRHWILPTHGWVFEPEDSTVRTAVIARGLKEKYGLVATDDTIVNFERRANLFLADNERGKRLLVRVGDHRYLLPTSHTDGHVEAEIRFPVEATAEMAKDGTVPFKAVLPPGDSRTFSGKVLLTSARGISVISDIDDTVKVAEVTDHSRMFDRTFFQDFEAVDGMATLYARWAECGVRFHFVSSSPWQLYEPLAEFLEQHVFPPASMSLRAFRFRDPTFYNLFRKGTETKPLQIEPILNVFPERHFVLIGDSGEQDPEVYADIMRKYAKQILRIYIRNVSSASAADSRFQEVFRGISPQKWMLFCDPSQLELPVAPHSP